MVTPFPPIKTRSPGERITPTETDLISPQDKPLISQGPFQSLQQQPTPVNKLEPNGLEQDKSCTAQSPIKV